MLFDPLDDAASSPFPGLAGPDTAAALIAADQAAAGPFTTVIETDHLIPEEWDRLVARFDDGLYEQLDSYAAGGWGRARLSHLTVKRDGHLIGAAQAVLLRPPAVRRGIAYVKFGPLWRRKGCPTRISDFKAVLQALVAEYAGRRCMHLTVLPRAEPALAAEMAAALKACGFRSTRAMTDPNRYLVDLTVPADELRRSLCQKWRYNLRRSERHALDIASEEPPGALAEFKSLYDSMVARKQFRDSSGCSVLDELFGRVPRAFRPEIILARHGEEAVAGAVVGRIGDTATYLFGASSRCGLELNAGYALHWWIIDRLARQGARWYDLGGEADTPGLRQFKKGLVGKAGRVVQLPGEFDYCEDVTSAWLAMMIYRARDLRRLCRALADGKPASAKH